MMMDEGHIEIDALEKEKELLFVSFIGDLSANNYSKVVKTVLDT